MVFSTAPRMLKARRQLLQEWGDCFYDLSAADMPGAFEHPRSVLMIGAPVPVAGIQPVTVKASAANTLMRRHPDTVAHLGIWVRKATD
jgi:hypothetical protein